MTKKIVNMVKENKSPAVKKDSLVITNHMRCDWGVPHELQIENKGMKISNANDRNVANSSPTEMIRPNQSVIISKEGFDRYYKGCRPFQYLIDTKKLVCKKKVVDVHALSRIETQGAPAELTEEDTNVALMKSDSLDMAKMASVKPVNK